MKPLSETLPKTIRLTKEIDWNETQPKHSVQYLKSLNNAYCEGYDKGVRVERKRILKIMDKLVEKGSGDISYPDLKRELEAGLGSEKK